MQGKEYNVIQSIYVMDSMFYSLLLQYWILEKLVTFILPKNLSSFIFLRELLVNLWCCMLYHNTHSLTNFWLEWERERARNVIALTKLDFVLTMTDEKLYFSFVFLWHNFFVACFHKSFFDGMITIPETNNDVNLGQCFPTYRRQGR